MGEHDEFLADFLEECDENLDQLDQELVALEEDPRNQDRLRSIFRNIHTIKGSSGFFGFVKLGVLAHDGETLLGKVRDGELIFNRAIASALLKMADAIREVLANIEQTGREGEKEYLEIAAELQGLLIDAAPHESQQDDPSPQAPAPSASEPAVVSDTGASESSAPVGTSATKPQESAGGQGNIDNTAANSPIEQQPSSPIAGEQDGTAPTAVRERSAQKAQDTPSTPPAENTNQPDDSKSAVPAKATDSGSVRVDVGLLDELMDFAGELVLARNALFQCNEVSENAQLAGVTNRVSQITSEIQERVTRTRMQPIGAIWGKFRRVVRDLSVACGKQVRLELIGEDTEIDRSLLEAIRDPLTHIVRNSIDHGIELPEVRIAAGKRSEGVLTLRARHESGQVVIEAVDDGAGIDVGRVRQKAIASRLLTADEAEVASPEQILQCIFEPGFSTAKQVSEISGRGVGMDVVRSHIEKIGGSVQLKSTLGSGTTLTIKIPLTLAIVPALMISSGGERFVIPQSSLQEVVTVGGPNPIERLHNVPVCRLRDRVLPLVWLDEVLGLETGDDGTARGLGKETFPVAVLKVEQLRYGLIINEVLNTHEIVVKPIGASVKAIGTFSAATILGDGSVALILDVGGIAKLANLTGGATESGTDATPDGWLQASPETNLLNAAVVAGNENSLLVCEDDKGREIGILLENVERLEELPASSIQQIESGWVASYRGGVLPIRFLCNVASTPDLNSGSSQPHDASDATLQIVVHRVGDDLQGAVVSRIVDIVDLTDDPEDAGDESSRDQINRLTPGGQLSLIDGRVVEIVNLGESHP